MEISATLLALHMMSYPRMACSLFSFQIKSGGVCTNKTNMAFFLNQEGKTIKVWILTSR